MIWLTISFFFKKKRTDFLAGQFFDIRLEVHAPVNGSQANGGIPDPNFTFTIEKVGGKPQDASKFFNVKEPALEQWNFTWYEGMYDSMNFSHLIPLLATNSLLLLRSLRS